MRFEEYASVPIAFEVSSLFDIKVISGRPAQFLLTERRIDVPYIKDYDSIHEAHPTQWTKQFDLSNWKVLSAWVDERRVGGVAVAFRTPGLMMLEGREDLAVLWDLRVAPEARGQGIGALLFRAAEAIAIAKGCRQLMVETQNINVAACRFYERLGCKLKTVNYHAYPELPNEIQLLWYKDLSYNLPHR